MEACERTVWWKLSVDVRVLLQPGESVSPHLYRMQDTITFSIDLHQLIDGEFLVLNACVRPSYRFWLSALFLDPVLWPPPLQLVSLPVCFQGTLLSNSAKDRRKRTECS